MATALATLHALGCAGALTEVGLPETHIPLALLTLNLGVELCQLAFVPVAMMLRAAQVPVLAGLSATCQLRWRLAPALAIGCLAAFWCLERVSAFG
jgi:hypothetical protein